jgi:DNA-binding NarL/FixJ family response regulator
LETQNNWEVVGEAASGLEAIRMAESLKPDAIVMDITMPDITGLEATQRIVNKNPEMRVLIVTMHENPGLKDVSQNVGASGLLRKSDAAREITPALHSILAGRTYFS